MNSTVKRIYARDFLLGIAVGLVFIFIPALVAPESSMTGPFSSFAYGPFGGVLIFILLLCPLFLLSFFASSFRNELKEARNRTAFVVVSLLLFSAGLAAAYGAFTAVILVALSGANGFSL